MSSNVKDVLQAPILFYDTIDSTNNCAAQMINDDTAQEGLTIVAKQQFAGKGQRGHIWQDEPAQSLLMSMVLAPKMPIEQQFAYSAAVAVAIVDTLRSFDSSLDIKIKFPNDIIINDKKAAGILIENAIRGNLWTHAIIGIGLNVFQKSFSPHLPNATSLAIQSAKNWDIDVLLQSIRNNTIKSLEILNPSESLLAYNQNLYGMGKSQYFRQASKTMQGLICGVSAQGKLIVEFEEGIRQHYAHGELEWIW